MRGLAMAKAFFWAAWICVVYVYFGYPLLLMVWRKWARRPVRKEYRELSVSVVIAMHNERKNVEAKLRNCFELDYPADLLQVIVTLDAPTDGTDEVLREYTSRGVEVVCSPVRRGKAEALNRGLAAAKGEIVVFAD